MLKDKVVEILLDEIEKLPAPDMSSVPLPFRGLISGLLNGKSPVAFVAGMISTLPDEHLPTIIEAARRILSAVDDETQD